MRLADLPRGENRAILNRLYNGDPPFSEDEAEDNDVQINRNDLTGVNILSQARRQWMQAFLKPGNYFSVTLDSGPVHKRREWSHIITEEANRVLRKSRPYMEQQRATGAGTLLNGIGPCTWRTRRNVVCRELAVSSLMIPSETEISFENLPYVAIFNEMTYAQLYANTHGNRVDPGWNMPLVEAQLRYIRDQVMKQPNATAFQYMPERIEELVKQDLGFWGSDAVPTVDFWDFYFREDNDGPIYRRVILDWGLAEGDLNAYKASGQMPKKKIADEHFTKSDKHGGFLYTSGKRRFADSWEEIFHCQFGDCSAVPPFRYHSVRSLGWMLWGVCDLENRLHCRFSESLFEQMLWLFSVASNEQMTRLRKADIFHMGVVPPGINMLKAADRFIPDKDFVQMGFARFKQLMAENASAFTQDFERTGQKEMTATETMARVNSMNALVSGMLTLAYNYEEYKDRETVRRLCIPGNPDPLSREFRTNCLAKGVPAQVLDVKRMVVTRERVLGVGNKTLEMAQVQFLQQMRKNLGPDAQRAVDHIAIESATDDAQLAAELAPTDTKPISNSMHDAQLSTDRLLRGLPLAERPDMVYEDYVKVWLSDLATLLHQFIGQGAALPTPEQLAGFGNMVQHIGKFLEIMGQDDSEKEKVTEYRQGLSKLENLIKGLQQRMVQAARAQAKGPGANGVDPKDVAKAQATVALARTKQQLAQDSHAQRTAQKQIAFELEQQRKDREHQNEMGRLNREHDYEMLTGHVQRLTDKFARATQAAEPAEEAP
jgi:hypothetical protein